MLGILQPRKDLLGGRLAMRSCMIWDSAFSPVKGEIQLHLPQFLSRLDASCIRDSRDNFSPNRELSSFPATSHLGDTAGEVRVGGERGKGFWGSLGAQWFGPKNPGEGTRIFLA